MSGYTVKGREAWLEVTVFDEMTTEASSEEEAERWYREQAFNGKVGVVKVERDLLEGLSVEIQPEEDV
jgi:hypothetical protein